jgi:hypothetical protein
MTSPATCSRCGVSNGVTAPSAPEVETYTAYFRNEYDSGDNLWKITGVFAEANYWAPDGFPIPLKIYYVTTQNSATVLVDLYPGDYAYRGSFYEGEDCYPCGNYADIEPYGHFESVIRYDEPVILSGGYYENLPKGSWYFGSVQFSDSFFIVVDDYEAADLGIIPHN